ncbi:MAG: FKBP-type peptidyl-prolyl cis-trans isomerase [Aeromicrobium sp.]|uniref:FKBP-type peptidyl-prolyl cis-trans isomerase n=1 Tax=Aeromicrobium sp. TaxID=1871063 RepID=UPI0039E46891
MRRNIILISTALAVVAVLAASVIVLSNKGFAFSGVTVSGGETPKLSVKEPEKLADEIKSGEAKLQIVSEGDGRKLQNNDYFSADYIIADGTDGSQLDSSFGTNATTGEPGTPAVFQFIDSAKSTTATAPGLPKSALEVLKDVKVGSKVILGITAGDFFGDAVQQFGFEEAQPMLFYFDITASIDADTKTAPSGKKVDLPAGVPTPVVDGDTVTGVDGSAVTAPATEAVYPVIKGTGPKVEADDYVYANYLGQVYPNGAVFDSSFERGAPSLFSLAGVIPCWTDMLTGQTVGSRVVLTCPADVAYGDNPGEGSGIAPGDSLTFVVDIVGTL